MPAAGQLPTHTQSLAGIDGIMYEPFGDITLTWSDLTPGATYEVYVFGHDPFDSAQTQQVTITGADSPVTFTQSSVDHQLLFVNDRAGDINQTLVSYAKIVAADASGTIVIQVDPFDLFDSTALGGVALRPVQAPPIPTISIGPATLSQAEGQTGSTSFNFQVSLSENPSAPVTVRVDTANGSATVADGDYTAINNRVLTFNPNGSLSQTVTVNVSGDRKVELNETFTVNLSNPSGATIASGTATATIQNDDSATLSINDLTMAEGNAPATTAFTFTVTLSAAVDAGVSVDFATADDTATVADSDYSANSGTLSFSGNAGETKTITVNVTGDNKVERDERFFVNLSNLLAAGRNVTIADNQGFGTISNDDSATLSINDVTMAEGNTAGTTAFTFTVTLSAAVQGGFNVAYTTNNGTATTADGDYVDNDGSLTFAGTAGETKTITVLVNKDAKVEADETFTVLLGALSNLGAGVAASKITVQSTGGDGVISNDDTATLTIDDVTLNEGTGAGTTSFTFTVTLSAAVQGGFNVAYTTNNGTATTADSDYVDNDGSLTFAGTAGETKTITVLVNKDAKVEADETFTVLLGALEPGRGGRCVEHHGASHGRRRRDQQRRHGHAVDQRPDANEGTGAGTTSFTFTVTLQRGGARRVQRGLHDEQRHSHDGGRRLCGQRRQPDVRGNGGGDEDDHGAGQQGRQGRGGRDVHGAVGSDLEPGAGVAASKITVQSTGGDGVISNDDTATLSINDVTAERRDGSGNDVVHVHGDAERGGARRVQRGLHHEQRHSHDGGQRLCGQRWQPDVRRHGGGDEDDHGAGQQGRQGRSGRDVYGAVGMLSNLGAGVAASKITVQSTGGDGVITNDDAAAERHVECRPRAWRKRPARPRSRRRCPPCRDRTSLSIWPSPARPRTSATTRAPPRRS